MYVHSFIHSSIYCTCIYQYHLSICQYIIYPSIFIHSSIYLSIHPSIHLHSSTHHSSILHSPEISYDLKDLLLRLLNKQPDDRFTIPEIRRHPWFTNTSRLIPTTQKNCQCVINVSEEEIEEAVQKIRTPIHILVSYKVCLNPYCSFCLSVTHVQCYLRQSSV